MNGQAEIAGIPKDVLRTFSKRTSRWRTHSTSKIDEFVEREGRDPSEWERRRARPERQPSTHVQKKSGNGVADLTTRWIDEAHDLGWTGHDLVDEALLASPPSSRHEQTSRQPHGARRHRPHVVDGFGVESRRHHEGRSATSSDRVASQDGERWAASLERACDVVMEACIDLDPIDTDGPRRASDGRSLARRRSSRHITSERILAEEDFIISWAIDAQAVEPHAVAHRRRRRPRRDAGRSRTSRRRPRPTRPRRRARRCRQDDHTARQPSPTSIATSGRPVFGVAPSAKAAHVLKRETGLQVRHARQAAPRMGAHRPRPTHRVRPPARHDGHRRRSRHGRHLRARPTRRRSPSGEDWRLVLVGDHHQLQAVGRGGMFHELCRHRAQRSNSTASIASTNRGKPPHRYNCDTATHVDSTPTSITDESSPARFDDHLRRIAKTWLDTTDDGRTIAITASTNEHVDKINGVIQYLRTATEQISAAGGPRTIGGDESGVRRRHCRHSPERPPARQRASANPFATASRGPSRPSGTTARSPCRRMRGSGTVTLAGRLRQRARPARLRRHRTRQPGRHRRRWHRTCRPLPRPNEGSMSASPEDGGTTRSSSSPTAPTSTTHERSFEYVLASDRADIPATTQRRLLAEIEQPTAPSRPSLTARCEAPTWFADLQSEVARRLAAANAEVERRANEDRAGLRPHRGGQARPRGRRARDGAAPSGHRPSEAVARGRP